MKYQYKNLLKYTIGVPILVIIGLLFAFLSCFVFPLILGGALIDNDWDSVINFADNWKNYFRKYLPYTKNS